MSRPFVFAIDFEPDEREIPADQRKAWSGCEIGFELLADLRRRLRERTARAVHLTWFVRLDPQIEAVYGDPSWPLRHYAGRFDELRKLGDEIGVHTHAWRWHQPTGGWISAHGDPDWTAACVRTSITAFAGVFGRPPASFRFGDRWQSNATVALLSKLGVRYDLTLEPGARELPAIKVGELATGSLPDYREVPRYPYRPKPSDYRVAGTRWRRRRITMLPVSTGCVNDRALPTTVLPEHDFVHLNLCLHPHWIKHLLDGLLVGQDPVIVSVMRAGDLAFAVQRDNFLVNVETLANHPELHSVRFATPASAVGARGIGRRARRD